MAKPRLVILSGWGYPPHAWASSRRALDAHCETIVLDPLDLLDETGAGMLDVATDRIRSHCESDRTTLLGGWSLGGMIVLQCASRIGPNVAGLLLIGTTLRFCADEGQPWGVPAARVRAMRHRLRQDPMDMLTSFYRDAASPSEEAASDEMPWLPALTADTDRLAAGLTYLERTDLRRGDPLIVQPAVVLHGECDDIVRSDAGRALVTHLQPSRLVLVQDAGHDLPLRCPEHVIRAVHDLLDMVHGSE